MLLLWHFIHSVILLEGSKPEASFWHHEYEFHVRIDEGGEGWGREGGTQGSLLTYLGMLLATSLFANTLPSISSSILRGSFGWMLPLSSPGQLSGRSLTAGAHEGSFRSTAVPYRGEGTHSWGGSMEKGSLGPCQRPFPAPPPPSAMRGVTSAITLWATSQFI